MKLQNANIEIETIETQVEETPKELEANVEIPKKKKKATKPKKVEEPVNETATKEDTDFGALILEWKTKYKKIFKNELDGEIVIWRRLKRGEYKAILAEENENDDNPIMTKQEAMVKTAVLYPFNAEEFIEENAGVATVLSEEILAKSGFAISYTEEL